MDIPYQPTDPPSMPWPDYRNLDLDLSLVTLNVDGSPSMWSPQFSKFTMPQPKRCAFRPTTYLRREDGTLITGVRSFLDSDPYAYHADLFTDYQLDFRDWSLVRPPRPESYGPAATLAVVITDGLSYDSDPIPQSARNQPSWPTSGRKKRRR